MHSGGGLPNSSRYSEENDWDVAKEGAGSVSELNRAVSKVKKWVENWSNQDGIRGWELSVRYLKYSIMIKVTSEFDNQYFCLKDVIRFDGRSINISWLKISGYFLWLRLVKIFEFTLNYLDYILC